MLDIPGWIDSAACREADVNEFFPRASDHAGEKRAKMICAECPVRLKCLQWQMDFEGSGQAFYRAGIFGGTTPQERAKLAKGAEVAS